MAIDEKTPRSERDDEIVRYFAHESEIQDFYAPFLALALASMHPERSTLEICHSVEHAFSITSESDDDE